MAPSDTPRRSILIAGGGTAGHLLPGISTADALVARGVDPADIHFVGSDRGVEADLVPAAGYTVTELPGRGLQRRLSPANLGAIAQLLRGLRRGVGLVRRRRPRVVVVLGGYASFACGVGAVLTRTPLVLLEQNARAGAVNRALRWFATASAVSFPDTDLPRAVLTGNPLRRSVSDAAQACRADPAAMRRAARTRLGLPADRTVVAVATGSLGARRVNVAVRELIDRWEHRGDVAVRHVVGRRDFADYVAELAGRDPGALHYDAVEYEDQMHDLLAAADLAVTRAGGGVAELAAFGVPAVLVPLPIAPRDHQRANAQHLVDAGGAILLDDAACDGAELDRLLTPLLDDDERRQRMADAMRRAAHLDAADRVAELIEEVADGHRPC